MRNADVATGAGVVALVVGGTALHGGALDAGALVLITVAAGAAGLLRRVAPVWGLGVAIAAVFLYLRLGYPYGPVQLALVLAMFEVARQRPLRISTAVCAAAALVMTLSVLPRIMADAASPELLSVVWASWIVLPWSLGALVQAVRVAHRNLVARGALEERTRLAADVHDVAGHGFSLIAMQAGVALLVFDENPVQARTSLAAIHETSTASLAELRGMLSAFHGPDRIAELVDRVRAGGLPVDLDVEVDVPVDSVAYRVVQESLTNVVRHAGPARAEVRITKRAGELLVRVTDNGQGAGEAAPGRGLTGMRTRVESAGGRFTAGAGETGGFQVTAALPLAGAR